MVGSLHGAQEGLGDPSPRRGWRGSNRAQRTESGRSKRGRAGQPGSPARSTASGPAQPSLWAACLGVPALPAPMPTLPLRLIWRDGAGMLPPFHRKESRLRDQSRGPSSCHHRLSPRSESEPSSSRATGQGLARPAGHSGLGSWLPGNLPEKKTRRASSEPGPFCLSGTGASVGIALGEEGATILLPGVLVPWEGMGRTPARATPLSCLSCFLGGKPHTHSQGLRRSMGLSEAARPRDRSQQTRGPACPPGPRCPALPCPELSAHQGGAEAGDLCHAGGEGPSRGQVGGSGSPWASPRRWAKSRLGRNKLVFTAARKHEELAEHTDSPSRACGRAGRPPRRLLVTLPGHTRAGGAVFA